MSPANQPASGLSLTSPSSGRPAAPAGSRAVAGGLRAVHRVPGRTGARRDLHFFLRARLPRPGPMTYGSAPRRAVQRSRGGARLIQGSIGGSSVTASHRGSSAQGVGPGRMGRLQNPWAPLEKTPKTPMRSWAAQRDLIRRAAGAGARGQWRPPKRQMDLQQPLIREGPSDYVLLRRAAGRRSWSAPSSPTGTTTWLGKAFFKKKFTDYLAHVPVVIRGTRRRGRAAGNAYKRTGDHAERGPFPAVGRPLPAAGREERQGGGRGAPRQRRPSWS